MAGLSCAQALAEAGVVVTMFDKGRTPGGRVATRHVDAMQFDHGAQYATARDPGFRAWLDAAQADGDAAPWPAAADGGDARWVGTPGMSALAAALHRRLPSPVWSRRHVAQLHRGADGWRVRHMDAAAIAPGTVAASGGVLAGPFDVAVLALPAPQTASLLRTAGHAFALAAERASYAPCWAAMAAFSSPVDAPDAQRHADGPLRWTAREASRPRRPAAPDCWVLHASAEWSRANLERDAAAVAAELAAAFAAAPAPRFLAAHRWRYALVETALGEDCLWDQQARIGACGDWCIAGRVEAAWLSGRALAARALGRT